ncbi:MAG: ABC transporter permease [Propionibacteriales bacterium]|nr:ABC transporter permease [Propionibacteriales bacterium]
MVRAQAWMEIRLLLRNGEQLLLALVIPLVVLVAGAAGARALDVGGARPIDTVAPGVLALAVMSTSLTSLAIATGFERRYGVLKRLGASPLPRSGLLAAKVCAILLVELLQSAVIVPTGLALGWRPDLSVAAVAGAAGVAAAGTAAFAALGLLIAGTLRAEATLAAANLLFVLFMIGGGVVVPSRFYGDAGALVEWLPSALLGDGMRGALVSGDLPWTAIGVLLAWAAAGTFATMRTFKWE